MSDISKCKWDIQQEDFKGDCSSLSSLADLLSGAPARSSEAAGSSEAPLALVDVNPNIVTSSDWRKVEDAERIIKGLDKDLCRIYSGLTDSQKYAHHPRALKLADEAED